MSFSPQVERLRKSLRRLFLSAPLFLPLVAVVGAIMDGMWLLLWAVALLLGLGLRLWRISAAVLLCGGVAWLHGELLERSTEGIRELSASHGLVQLEGTVEKKMQKGVILGQGLNESRVAVRGENDLQVGERVMLLAEPISPRGIPMPGLFDSVAWMRGLGIAAEFYLVEVCHRRPEFSLHRLRYNGLEVRDYLANRLMPPGTEQDAARQVLCALVLGARERAEEEVLDDFRRGGCLHAFAVSGLHVGLFSGILLLLLRWLRCPVRLAHYLVMFGVGAYVLLTGASVPALRAYLLLVLMLAALLLRRRCHLMNAWSAAALAVLMLAPHQLFNAGFLLSFAVYGALCIGLRYCMAESPWFSPDPYIPYRILTRWERAYKNADFWLRGVVVVSVSAWLAAVPITLVCFHTFNTWSILTNIAITPILPVVMFCGLLHLGVGWMPFLGIITDWMAVKSAGVLLAVVSFFGGLPAAWLPAALPAEQQEVLVVGSGFGQSFTVLGNHGMVINPGSEANVSFRTFPAIFHSGFTPSVILQTRPSKSYAAGAELLHKQFAGAELYSVDALHAERKSIRTGAGVFTLFPAGKDYPHRLADSRMPIIHWEHSPEWRVLFVGNAPADAWYRMPEDKRRAELLILGRHPVQPLSLEDIRAVGAGYIIQLPGSERTIRPEHIAPAVLIEMKDEDWLKISPEGVSLNGL